jgi:hypothetical protein
VVPRGGSGTVVWMRGGYRGWRAYMTVIELSAARAQREPTLIPLEGR